MYFANFPLIPYDSVGNGELKLVTNLMKRVALRTKVRANTYAYVYGYEANWIANYDVGSATTLAATALAL